MGGKKYPKKNPDNPSGSGGQPPKEMKKPAPEKGGPPSDQLSQMSLSGQQGPKPKTQDKSKTQSQESLASTSGQSQGKRQQQQQQKKQQPKPMSGARGPEQQQQAPQLQGSWAAQPQQQQPKQAQPQKKPEPPKSQQQHQPPMASGSRQQQAAPRNVQQKPASQAIPTAAPHLICEYKGPGGKGKKVDGLEANYLKLDISKLVQVAYHYDVTIAPEVPKKKLPLAFTAFCRKNFGNTQIAFDGRKNAYAPCRLDLEKREIVNAVEIVDAETGNTRKYTVHIQEANDSAISMGWLKNYTNMRQYDIPARALQCLEIVMKGVFQGKNGVQAGRSFFMRPQGKREDLGDYFELWLGLFQSIVLGRVPFLNVDVAHKAFPKRYDDMLQLIDDVHNTLRMRFDPHRSLDQRVIEALNTHLRGMDICYNMPGNAGKKIHKFLRLDNIPANVTFEQEGRRISVQQYFQSRGNRIQFPNLPCVQLGNALRSITVPIECCSLFDGQALNRKTTENQTRAIIRVAATSTDVRKQKIMDLLRQIDHNRSPAMRDFGLTVDNKFTQVPARILTPPLIEYSNNKTMAPQRGVWRGEGMPFLIPERDTVWGVINADYRTQRSAIHELCGMIARCSGSAKMNLAREPAFIKDIDSRASDKVLETQLDIVKKEKASIAFVIIPDFGNIYAKIKQLAEIKCGVLTQCIKAGTVFRKRSDGSTISNILLKVNAKLNGTNHRLQPGKTIDDKTLQTLDRCMVIGADVTHPSPDQQSIPSVVGVAASHDRNAFTYNIGWRLQGPRQEIIEDFKAIIQDQLKFYKEKNGYLPTKLIYYRDGVSEGQFQQVMGSEKQAMLEACRIFGEDYRKSVKLTIIVVQKRHHTRFFPGKSGIGQDDRKNNNVPAGTIVDSEITQPNENYFFLVSHQSIQGVAKPTKYCILYDDSKFSIDDIQGFSYNLCHLFTRCNRAVSYPAPTYYAHLAAYRGRVYIEGNRLNMNDLNKEWANRKIRPEIIHDHPMYFV